LKDWLALIIEIILPVRDLINIKNGRFRNPLNIISLRIYKLKYHLKDKKRSEKIQY